MCNLPAAALNEPAWSIAFSKRHFPSPNTPSARSVDSQSFKPGDSFLGFFLT